MKVNVEELSSVQRKVTVEIPAKDVDKTVDTLYKRLSRQAKIKGFRPGKVPRSILEKYYAPQVAVESAENLISDRYPEALSETKLEPVARPDFDFGIPVAGQDFIFSVTLDVKPEFTLETSVYKGLKLKEPQLQVNEAEVGMRLEALASRQAVLAPLEEFRLAQAGDVVIIDYQSFKGEDPVAGGQAENVEVELGKGQVQTEIEVALLRAQVGDSVETTVHYGPEANNPELQDQDVRFVMQVKDVKKKLLPEIDDDFARALSPKFDSLKALKDRIIADLEESYQVQRDMALRNQILDQLRDQGEFEVPASLVRAEAEGMVESFKNRMRQQGMDPQVMGLEEDKLAEGFKEQAQKKVRAGIVLGRIAEQERVEVKVEDIDKNINKMAVSMGQPVGIIKEMYIKNNMMPTLQARILEEKTLQAITVDAIIEKVDPAELAKETKA
ncbi:Trigger factor [Desulfarculales bacterium]